MANRTLVIDTATQACSVAFFDDAILLAAENRMLGRGHAEQLIPMIAALPDKGRAEHILVNCGPGSFTGVRVGLAAAKALALAWRAELKGYGTLGLIARMAMDHLDTPQSVECAMTGGHGEWFVQRFNAECRDISPLLSLLPEEAAQWSQAGIVAGNEAVRFAALNTLVTPIPLETDARFALSMPEAMRAWPASPVYGRAPDAKPLVPLPG